MLPGGGPSVDDNLRSGQAQQHDTKENNNVPTTNTKNSNYDYDGEDNTDDNNEVADIEEELDIVHEDLKQAQQQELETNKSALAAAIEVTGSYVRSAFSKLLAKTDITEAEIEQMVEEVENKLEKETIEELKEESEAIVATLEDQIEEEAFDESDSGVAMEDIRTDMEENEEMAIREMKAQIDKKADEMKKMMRKKAEEFEIEILEKRLEEKLHKKVKLVVLDDELTDVDHILEGLSILKGGSGSDDLGKSSYGSVPAPQGGSSTSGDNDDDKAGTTSKDDDTTASNDDDAN